MNLKSYRGYLLLSFIYSWYIQIVVEIYQTSYCPSDPRPPRPSDVVIEDSLCNQYSIERDCRFIFTCYIFCIDAQMQKSSTSFATYKNKYRTSITLEITDLGI